MGRRPMANSKHHSSTERRFPVQEARLIVSDDEGGIMLPIREILSNRFTLKQMFQSSFYETDSQTVIALLVQLSNPSLQRLQEFSGNSFFVPKRDEYTYQVPTRRIRGVRPLSVGVFEEAVPVVTLDPREVVVYAERRIDAEPSVVDHRVREAEYLDIVTLHPFLEITEK